jgi:hypothetical protein
VITNVRSLLKAWYRSCYDHDGDCEFGDVGPTDSKRVGE